MPSQNQLENWKSTNDCNKQNFVAFALFLKRLVQAFQYLGYRADLQSSTLIKKAKEKVPHNILLKWTEHTVTSIETPATLVEFQKRLEATRIWQNSIFVIKNSKKCFPDVLK